MNSFAKIFDTEDYQILITKEFDEEDEGTQYKLQHRSDFDGVEVALSGVFDSEEKRNVAFDEYDETPAKEFIKQIEKMMQS